MLAYFDTSAVVPLIIAEPTTGRCRRLWAEADTIVTCSLTYVEAHAAFAQAMRSGRLTTAEHRVAIRDFEARWNDMVRVAPNDALIRAAARLCATQTLRGYDAIHAATASAVASDDFVAVAGDRELRRAWSSLGLATADTASVD